MEQIKKVCSLGIMNVFRKMVKENEGIIKIYGLTTWEP